MEYTRHKEMEIGVRALQGVGSLFLRKPRLLVNPKVKSIIDAALMERSHTRYKEAMLRLFTDLLFAEEVKANQSGVNKDKEKPENFVALDENPDFGYYLAPSYNFR